MNVTMKVIVKVKMKVKMTISPQVHLNVLEPKGLRAEGLLVAVRRGKDLPYVWWYLHQPRRRVGGGAPTVAFEACLGWETHLQVELCTALTRRVATGETVFLNKWESVNLGRTGGT
jgi:hypothetical protein